MVSWIYNELYINDWLKKITFCYCAPYFTLLSQGSLGLMSCPVTAALTPASSHTSVHFARRSSPAATTCPNTPRSTAAPGPAGLSEPRCDTFRTPKTLLTPTSLPQFWPGHSGNSLRTFGAPLAGLSEDSGGQAAVLSPQCSLLSFLFSVPFHLSL